uniref:Uncharacterized protein n=1 Tax=Meloidogyne hapla TaxID=6305 RepID=A0A1I8AZH9_MELHA
MISALALMPSVAEVPPIPAKPTPKSATTHSTPSQTSEDCMDDGRLVDSALGGIMIALILILTWHVIRLCCCKHKPVQYPPQAPPTTAGTGNNATTSVRSNTSVRAGASVRSATSERIKEHTQKSKTESVRSKTESQKKALGTIGTGTTGTTSSSMRNTGSTK